MHPLRFTFIRTKHKNPTHDIYRVYLMNEKKVYGRRKKNNVLSTNKNTMVTMILRASK